MKSKKINVKMMAIILLICLNIIFILINLNNKNQSIEKQISSKGQLEETTENAYVSMKTHISELNAKQQEIDNIQNTSGQATATADQILKDYTAYKNGKLITGTMVNRGAWTNTPTASGKVTIPAGYHNGKGYVDTSSVYNAGVANTEIPLIPYQISTSTNWGTIDWSDAYKHEFSGVYAVDGDNTTRFLTTESNPYWSYTFKKTTVNIRKLKLLLEETQTGGTLTIAFLINGVWKTAYSSSETTLQRENTFDTVYKNVSQVKISGTNTLSIKAVQFYGTTNNNIYSGDF